MEYAVCILIGYLVGGINPSYLFARLRGFDIRKQGSGNAGASNAAITMGKAVGVVSGVLDILKAFLCYRVSQWVFPEALHIGIAAAAACVLGHIFPVYMKFRGGKGLACVGGAVLAYDWRLFLILLAVEVVVVLATDYICFVSISAPILFGVLYGILEKSAVGGLIFAVPAAVMFCRHLQNLKRIRAGKEVRFSFLWKGKKEIERITR